MVILDTKEQLRKISAASFGSPVYNLCDESSKYETFDAVFPKEGLPKTSLKLGLLDRTMFNIWSPTLYVFENKDKREDFMAPGKLKEALSEALSRVPILSGELQTMDGDAVPFIGIDNDYKIQFPGPGAWFAHEKIEGDFQHFKEQHFIYEMLPSSIFFKSFTDAVLARRNPPILAIKASYLKCGSVLMLVYFNHFVVDGCASYEFMKLWGDMMNHKSSYIKDCRHLFVPDGNICKETAEMIQEKNQPRLPISKQTAAVRPCRISIPLQTMKSIKDKINSNLENEFVTSDDIFTAVVWRAMTRARKIPLDSKSCVQRTIDVRKLVGISTNTLCNGIISTPDGYLNVKELLSFPLGEIVIHLRRQVKKLATPEYLNKYLNAISNTTPPLKAVPTADYWFGKDLLVSSYSKFDPTKVDFDNSPALLMTRVPYAEGHLVSHTPYNNQFYGYLGISEDILHHLLADTELQKLGFTSQVAPF